eukprot:scaffold222713_cov70-Cyclotella_meneghiniana.AAC.1
MALDVDRDDFLVGCFVASLDTVKNSLPLNSLCDIYDYTAVEDVNYPEFDPNAASQKMPAKEAATPPKADRTMSNMSTPTKR